MTQEEYLAELEKSKQEAAAHAEALLQHPTDLNWVRQHLRGFVLSKYFLDEEEAPTDELLKLGDLSTEKLAGLRRGGLELVDKSVGCTSVGSSIVKKALVILAMGKILGITFDPDKMAYIETISDWAKMVVEEMEKKAKKGEKS